MQFENTVHARAFAAELAALVSGGENTRAMSALSPVITDKNPFRLLDILGKCISSCPADHLLPFLDAVAQTHAEGAWVVIASALRGCQAQSLASRLEKAQSYIIMADIWYGADIFGERVPGPFLLSDFNTTLSLLTPWGEHPNPWVRRVIGVAAHFWAKRTRAHPDSAGQARQLLEFLSPLLEERDIRAAKGIGWGLKTLGRYYPDFAANWLREQIIIQNRHPIAVVRRKALTFLPEHIKAELSR